MLFEMGTTGFELDADETIACRRHPLATIKFG